MVVKNEEYKLDLIAEDFNSYNLSSVEINKRINDVKNVFHELKYNIEVNGRNVSWPSFNKLLIDYIRRSSAVAREEWCTDKYIRFEAREKIRDYLINYTGTRATDISSHLKMQMIDFLVYGESFEGGYTFSAENKEFIKRAVAYHFLAEVICKSGVEKLITTEQLRVSFSKYRRGSIQGFSPKVRISSMRLIGPLIK